MPYCRSCGLSMSEIATACTVCGTPVAATAPQTQRSPSAPIAIATFNATTTWVGRKITHQDGRFDLEEHGVITASDVLGYDAKGQLDWANSGMRDWVVRMTDPAVATPPLATATHTGKPLASTSAHQTRSAPIPAKRSVPKWVAALVIGVLVLAVVIGIASAASSYNNAADQAGGAYNNAANELRSSQTYTLGQFNQIQTGMTLQQVQTIMGSAGTQQVHNSVAGYTGDVYMWQNPNGSNLNVQFQNGTVIMKAQYGLQ